MITTKPKWTVYQIDEASVDVNGSFELVNILSEWQSYETEEAAISAINEAKTTNLHKETRLTYLKEY